MGLVEIDEGRKIVNTEYGSLTIIKSDGGFTYDTTDLAAIRYRLVDLNMDQIYYVVDSGQSAHFQQLFSVARKMGWTNSQNSNSQKHIEHINFGVVCGAEGKRIRARAGDTPRLIDLLDDSYDEALKVMMEKNPSLVADTKLIENLAFSCCK
jgi:arginyl-tRNA synthetase